MAAIEVDDDELARWCDRWLGCFPTDVLFSGGHLSSVTGLQLEDGRAVVVKVRPAAMRLDGCTFVQRHLWSVGFPCPEPLAGPVPLGRYTASAEVLVPGGQLLAIEGDAVERYAALLADLVRCAPSVTVVPQLSPSPPWVRWDHDVEGVWPPPDDRDDDLNAQPSWLDDIGRQVRRRLGSLRHARPVIGHGDWEAQNLRWRAGRPWVVYDWDSVVSEPEAVLVGHAAAVWPVGVTPGAASIAQTEAFLAAYQKAAGRGWSADEVQASWAAGLWVRAFNAKKAELDGDSDALDHGEALTRLRRAGVRSLPSIANYYRSA